MEVKSGYRRIEGIEEVLRKLDNQGGGGGSSQDIADIKNILDERLAKKL